MTFDCKKTNAQLPALCSFTNQSGGSKFSAKMGGKNNWRECGH